MALPPPTPPPLSCALSLSQSRHSAGSTKFIYLQTHIWVMPSLLNFLVNIDIMLIIDHQDAVLKM
jgi:hypothetical protein